MGAKNNCVYVYNFWLKLLMNDLEAKVDYSLEERVAWA